MSVFEGRFYSTAFRVRDDQAFEQDPEIAALRECIDIYSGEDQGQRMHCITSKDLEPRTRLIVASEAILSLLADAGPSDVPITDEQGWLAALQRHLVPGDGMVLMHDTDDGPGYQVYIASDVAGWTQGRRPA